VALPPEAPVCFPPEATVQLHSGVPKRMADVRVGDRVAIGGGEFGDVYMITHAEKDGSEDAFPYLAVTADSGHRIRLSSNHLLHVNGRMRPAEAVRPGDVVMVAINGTAAMLAPV
ncbi:unnamed protein product, partial [Phaeothamnion confervicola]